jgi:uncharacterized repeat protein (TIGR03803 family)
MAISSRIAALVLVGSVGSILAGRLAAQTFTTLHSFPEFMGVSSEGAFPYAGLTISGDTLYGTAHQGGTSGYGTIFAVKTNGTGFTPLYHFSGGRDGGILSAGLALSGNTLYGAANAFGASFAGTLFAVNTDGAGFTTLYSFTATAPPAYTNGDGVGPEGTLILSGNTLYGTTLVGGPSAAGTVFAVNTDGRGFRALHSFSNSDGAHPLSGLLVSGDVLYGTTAYGANGFTGEYTGSGTVFALKTDGSGFATLYRFTTVQNAINNDGANPIAGLALQGSTLYGTTQSGGGSGNGTVFKLGVDGTGFTTLYSFAATHQDVSTGLRINTDGANPHGGVTLSGNTLCGTASAGGSSGRGTVFKLNIDGTGFTILHDFSATHDIGPGFRANSDGAEPFGNLTLSGNTVYGTALQGGTWGVGTVFSIALPLTPPQLTIAADGANVTLMWPTNFTGFTLQSTTNLISPAAWTAVSPAPVVVNGQNTVTNSVSGTQQYYRLSQSF